MTILSTALINTIKSLINTNAVSDDNISVNVTFQLSGTTVSTWSPTTQLIPEMYASSGVSAFKGSYNLEEIEESGGLIEFGDVKFIIMVDDVSGILSTTDRVIESATTWALATTYELKQITKDPLNICYFLTGRAV